MATGLLMGLARRAKAGQVHVIEDADWPGKPCRSPGHGPRSHGQAKAAFGPASGHRNRSSLSCLPRGLCKFVKRRQHEAVFHGRAMASGRGE